MPRPGHDPGHHQLLNEAVLVDLLNVQREPARRLPVDPIVDLIRAIEVRVPADRLLALPIDEEAPWVLEALVKGAA